MDITFTFSGLIALHRNTIYYCIWLQRGSDVTLWGTQKSSTDETLQEASKFSVDFYHAWIYLAVCSHQLQATQTRLQGGHGSNTCRANSPCHREITDTSPGQSWLQRGRLREELVLQRWGKQKKKHLPDMSQKMFNCEWRKHCLPEVCVCYLFISRSGLPVEGSWRKNVGMLPPLGTLQPQTGIIQWVSVQRPPSSSTCLRQNRANYIARTPPPPHPRQPPLKN